MKKAALFSTLTALLVVSGCSTPTVPSTPKQKSGKYALQILRIEVPANGTAPASSFTPAPTRDIEALLKNPQATVTEFPIVYAAIGETAINDQTESISFPESYELITNTNGVVSVVYNQHKDIKIGQYVELTLQKVENGNATCNLNFYERLLQGMQTYAVVPATKTQDAVTASLPIFKSVRMKTKMTLAPGTWISMGGLVGETVKKVNTKEETKTVMERHLFVRILPPKGVPFQSTQPAPKVFRFPASELEKTTP